MTIWSLKCQKYPPTEPLTDPRSIDGPWVVSLMSWLGRLSSTTQFMDGQDWPQTSSRTMDEASQLENLGSLISVEPTSKMTYHKLTHTLFFKSIIDDLQVEDYTIR